MDPSQATAEETAQEIAVVLKTINDETFGVHLRRDALISELKAKVKVSTQVPEERQRLIYRGRVLEDSQRLSTYNVEDGHTIHVVARPQPPAAAASAAVAAAAPTPAQAEPSVQTQFGPVGREAAQMTGLGSLAETLLGRGADAAGRQARERSAPAPENLEHIRQSMLTMLTLMSTMSTVSTEDFHDRSTEQESKQSDPMESKENAGGTRYPRRQFFVGQWLDVKDTVDQWLESTVLDINDGKVLVHYNGWPSRWDEWIEFASPRIAPFRTRTSHVLSTASNSPSPVTTVAHAPTTGVNDMRLVLPEMTAMAKLMTSRLEELSQLYTEHRAHDPDSAQFNHGGSEAVASNLPWSSSQALPTEEIGFSAEKVARMNALASELAPLCDRFGRAVVDLAPQLQRLSPGEAEAPDTTEEEDASAYHFLARALGRTRRRSMNSAAATDRTYRQIISSTARGNPHAGGGNHLDIHIHAILTPTSGMFGGAGAGAGAGGAGATGAATNVDAQTNRPAGIANAFNPLRSLAELQGLTGSRRNPEPASAPEPERRDEGIGYRNASAMRRLFYPQPRLGQPGAIAAPAPAPAPSAFPDAFSSGPDAGANHVMPTHPPPPPHPAPAPPTVMHDDLDVLTHTRPPLPPRAASDSVVSAGATQRSQTHAGTGEQQSATPVNAPNAALDAAAVSEESARNSASSSGGGGGGGFLRAVLRRFSRNFSPQGPN